MSEETDTTAAPEPETPEAVETPAEEVVTPEAEPETPTPDPEPEPEPEPAKPAATGPAIDIDAECTAKETLADQLAEGEITYEAYAKRVAGHDKKIAQAQRQLAEPARQVAQTIQQQQQADAYWRNWGKGQDVAQKQFGKVPSTRAKTLYQQVVAEFQANPRYQRQEFGGERAQGIIYDKFMDALRGEANNKPRPAATTTKGAAARVSGSGGAATATGSTQYKTARERLEAGEFDLSREIAEMS